MIFRRRDRTLVTVIREQNALIERQTDRIMHLVDRDFQPTPRETAEALERNSRPEPERRETYQGLPEAYPD